MKHITEASDREIIVVILDAESGSSGTVVAALRAAFDFSSRQPAEGVAELIALTLVPVEVFGAENEGYGLMDAVEAWSDCNRAEGRIYRVDDQKHRLASETVTIYVKAEDVDWFSREWTHNPAANRIRPTPSDEELLTAYHGDDQHSHLRGSDHVKRLRAVAALTTPEGH